MSKDVETNSNKHKDKEGSQGVHIQRGDVYRLKSGTIFYMQSSLDNERQKLRIYAIFANSVDDFREPVIGPYSGIRDLVLGFDKKLLQAAFQMPEEAVEEITSARKPPQIVHAEQNSSSRTFWEVEAQFIRVFLGRNKYNLFDVNKKEKSTGVYNILTGDRDVQNCNGWSTAVTSKQSRALRGSSIGLFMVNLTKGAMMGPHWNPIATEIAIVLEGQGMVSVICPGSATRTECKNRRLRVKEGDAFVVPKYHPMAQMAFNNGTLVFVGFTTRNQNNHPQFLAGKRSVLQTLQKQVLAVSFNVSNSTVSRLLEPQQESVILECVSCAEEEERLMEEEIEKEKEEAREREEKKRREEEKRKREEEEARKREEAKRQEEEKRKRQEEEEEEKRREEEEEARKREEAEARRKEDEARKREKAEAAARRREEEKRRQEEEDRKAEEERKRKEEEEAAAREREEEKERKREEEAGRRTEEARKREKEKAEEEKDRKRQEEEQVQQEEARRQETAARKAKEDEQARQRKEQEETRRETEKAQEEEGRRQGEEHAQQEEARRQQEAETSAEEERQKRQQESQGGQEEQKYQPGGPGGEGRRVLTKM